jgi:hypothetical protein
VGLRGKVGAFARGEVSTAALAAYGTGNGDAYDLLEQVPEEGPARLAAWCAFVLQSHADNLLASGSSPGFCDQEALEEARALYELAGGWLDRARTARARPGSSLDVVVPQPYLRPHGPQGTGEVAALRATVETVQSRLGADLAGCRTGSTAERLRPTLAVLQSAVDAASGLDAGHGASPDLKAAIAQRLLAALDRGFQAGQLLASPELLAKPPPEPEHAPAALGSATLALLLPGDPGFDPWCLTDPLQRERRDGDGVSAGLLAGFWRRDPEPATTIALQSEVVAAIENGAAAYLPEGTYGTLAEIAKHCPWPGVLLAQGDVAIAGEEIGAGERFVLAVGGDAEFRRELARLPAAP